MQVVVLSGALARNEVFHRRVRGPFQGGKRLIWATGAAESLLSRRLSAALSEQGIPNRWLPLYQRPGLWQEVLTRPWHETTLAAFLEPVDVLVLSAPHAHLYELWRHLQREALIQETRFVASSLRNPLLQEQPMLRESAELLHWAQVHEELEQDLAYAREWFPCRLTAYIA